MGRIPEETIQRIIDNNDIVDIISEYVPLKKAGQNYMGVCPFHNDKGPSLSVSREKQLFHCFGCGASGNLVGFIMKIRNIEFIDTISLLAERVGININLENESPREQEEKKLKESIYSINLEAAKFFFNNRKKINLVNKYLNNRRMSMSVINKFGIGYSLNEWDSLLSYLKSKGYSNELILKSGLIIQKENRFYDRFRNRVMFPVFDIKKRIIGFGGRVLDDSKPKYLNSPETPVFKKGTNLYGLNFVVKSGIPDNIIIVEGYMDCISLHQHGIKNAVASLGTALTQEHAKLIRRYCKDVYICYDADVAGQAATLRGLEILKNAKCDVKVINIPSGKDPDEYIKTYGVDAFKELINNAVPVTEYRIKRALMGKNLKDYKDKIEFINQISEILTKTSNDIELYAYAEKIFDMTGIDTKIILEEVKKIKSNNLNKGNNIQNLRNNNIGDNIYILEHAYKKAEKSILSIAVNSQELYKYIKSKIKPDEFITSSYKEVAQIIYDRFENGTDFKPSDILIKFQDQNEISDIASIFQDMDTENLDNSCKLIDDYINTIKKYNLENKINELTVEIKKSEEENDIDRTSQLFQQLVMLQKQLQLF